MRGVSLEVASEEDLESLLALERRCHTHPWTPRHFAHALRDPGQGVLVLRTTADVGTVLAGYCVVAWAADEVEVHNLVVAPVWRRRGFGRALLEGGLRLAARRGARRALLEVRAGNGEAIALYRSAGFERVGLRRDYYAEPPEDALVLRREGLSPGSGALEEVHEGDS